MSESKSEPAANYRKPPSARTQTVRLSHAEWNELVRLIKDGELREV
jgi:hypothetical protein